MIDTIVTTVSEDVVRIISVSVYDTFCVLCSMLLLVSCLWYFYSLLHSLMIILYSINVTTDSTDIGSGGSNGAFGKSKLMIATMSGTPCIVVPNTTLPPVTVNIDSSMLIAAEYNYDIYPEKPPAVAATAKRVESMY